MRGAFPNPARVFWWQSVQLTAFDLAVFHVRSAWRYPTGWMFLLEFMWHSVQSTDELWGFMFFVTALPPVPWHEKQYELFGHVSIDGMDSVLSCSLPEEWHEEQPGFVEL